jgi:hypothetical protein
MNYHYNTKLMLPKIEPHLLPEERLLWLGKPAWQRLMTIPNAGLEPLAAVIVGVVLTGVVIALINISAAPAPASLLLVALLMVAALVPIIAQYFVAATTVYAVTTHRALILSGDELISFGAADINVLQCCDENDGTGDIIFKRIVRERLIPTSFVPYAAEVEEKIGFFGIPNPQHVHSILLNTFRTSPIQMWQDKAASTSAPRRKVTA